MLPFAVILPMQSNEQHPAVEGAKSDTSESFLKQCETQQLVMMLHTAQVRIGTKAELPNDMNRVVAIAHRLNNLYTAEMLSAGLAQDERFFGTAI